MTRTQKDPAVVVTGLLMIGLTVLVGYLVFHAYGKPANLALPGWGPTLTKTQESHAIVVRDTLKRTAPVETFVKYMNGKISIVTSSDPLRLRASCGDNYGLSFDQLWGFHKIVDVVRPGTEGYEKTKLDFTAFKCPIRQP